jgi:hypothetical protein
MSNPHDDSLQVELTRLRAMHRVHDAACIRTAAMPCIEPDYRIAYTAIVVGLTAFERHITDLAPKS